MPSQAPPTEVAARTTDVLQRSLIGPGITDLAVSWGRIAIFVVVAVVAVVGAVVVGVVGVLAAVLPARHAARMDVLRAITGS